MEASSQRVEPEVKPASIGAGVASYFGDTDTEADTLRRSLIGRIRQAPQLEDWGIEHPHAGIAVYQYIGLAALGGDASPRLLATAGPRDRPWPVTGFVVGEERPCVCLLSFVPQGHQLTVVLHPSARLDFSGVDLPISPGPVPGVVLPTEVLGTYNQNSRGFAVVSTRGLLDFSELRPVVARVRLG